MKIKWFELAKALMREKGITYDDLAEQLSVTRGAVSHWMLGKREPSIDNISKILKFLGVQKITLDTNNSLILIHENEEKDIGKKHKLTKEEEELIEIFESLPKDEAKKILLEMKAKRTHYDVLFEEWLRKKNNKNTS